MITNKKSREAQEKEVAIRDKDITQYGIESFIICEGSLRLVAFKSKKFNKHLSFQNIYPIYKIKLSIQWL